MDVIEHPEHEWAQAVERWQYLVGKFEAAATRMHALRAVAVARGLESEFNRLESQSLVARKTITEITRPMTIAYGWLTSVTLGLQNLRDIADEFDMPLVPDIPFYVINGAASVVSLLTYKMNNFCSLLEGK